MAERKLAAALFGAGSAILLSAIRAMVPPAVLLLSACGEKGPPLPDAGERSGARAPVAAPEIPGKSQAFEKMELPPGHFVRALPTGEAYDRTTAPVYRSLCLNCHATTQTSFAVDAWVRSLHARAGVLCGACHGAHEEGFVARPGPDRCLACHAAQVEAALSSAHGPERAPGMGCNPCHEIHSTDRTLAGAVSTCTICHLDSDHVQGYASSRMGAIFTREGRDETGDLRAPDCVYCHMPGDSIMSATGEFRNDRVTLHDPGITVRKAARDSSRLSEEAIAFLMPLCLKCHSEKNARYRLENSDPLLRHWTPVGMTQEVLRRPGPRRSASRGGRGAP